MTQVPARLVYENSSNNDEVIGSFQPTNPSNGNISTFTIEENGRNYTRVIVEGGPTLEDNMPVVDSDFGTSEPEIRVQIDSNLDGTWEQRARVYPEESGTTNDRGQYKNKQLWGFKKYYGESDVSTGTLSSTDLTAAVDSLLPSGYTAVYPNDITAPSLTEYSYNGSRQQAFNELQRQFEHFILFTTATDGNNDYIVRVQPKGYGGTETSFVRGEDAFTYNYWKKNDLSNIVSRVTVVGKQSDNTTFNNTYQAGTDTGDPDVDTYLTGLSDPERNRFKRVHVDYSIDSSTAQTIAENVLNPTGVEQGKIEAGLIPQSTINKSIGVLDESRGIDDVYTVVSQKDFFHQGVTQYSFEFESEATDTQREKWREHDSERAKVYPGDTINGGNSNTTTAETDLTVDDQGDTFDTTPDIPSGVSTSNTLPFSNTNVQETNFTLVDGEVNTITTTLNSDGETMFVDATLETQAGYGAEFIVEIALQGLPVFSFGGVTTNNGGDIDLAVPVPGDQSGLDISFTVVNKSGGSVTVDDQNMFLYGENGHNHGGGTYETLDHNHAAGVDNDPGHGDTTDTFTHNIELKDSDNNDLGNVNVASEDKTDR